MEAGDFELKKAFEETTTKNVRTIQEYTTETRRLVRDLEKQVTELKNMVAQRDKDLAQSRIQMSLILAELYTGGTN